MSFAIYPGATAQIMPVLQTELRLAWLEHSGPRYAEAKYTFDRVLDDIAYLLFPSGGGYMLSNKISRDAMSYVSWLMCLGASAGDELMLKVRCDPVGMGR